MQKTEFFQMRIEPGLHNRLKHEAAKRGLTMSALVRWALLSFFQYSMDHGTVTVSEVEEEPCTTAESR